MSTRKLYISKFVARHGMNTGGGGDIYVWISIYRQITRTGTFGEGGGKMKAFRVCVVSQYQAGMGRPWQQW